MFDSLVLRFALARFKGRAYVLICFDRLGLELIPHCHRKKSGTRFMSLRIRFSKLLTV